MHCHMIPLTDLRLKAALVSKTKEDARWILGVITAFDDEKERYTVEDIMEDVTAMQSAQASAPERYEYWCARS